VFGPKLGDEVVSFLWDGSGMFADFFIHFDRVLLSEASAWFAQDRALLFREAAARALDVEPRPYGEGRELTLSHILFGGKLPRWLGFDRGPIQLAGGRATPHQGQLYRAGDRATSFAPSLRFLTDFAEAAAHTRLIGGVSDRRFSKLYCNELAGWVAGTYKKLEP
jgi:penicillin amidase